MQVLARAKIGEKWGFIDLKGAWAIQPKFDAVGDRGGLCYHQSLAK